jgi:uncharacterized protein YkwD
MKRVPGRPRRCPRKAAVRCADLAAASLLALAALGSLGCGAAGTPVRFGGNGITEDTITAPASGAERYATTPTPGDAVLGGGDTRAVEAGVQRAAREAGSTLAADARLGLLAAWTAERLGDRGEPPPHELVEFFTRHLGLVEAVPHLLILGHGDAHAIEESVRSSVTQFLARQPYDCFGAAVVPRTGLTLVVVTLASRPVEFEPVARRQAPGSRVALRGRLLGALRTPSFAVTQPSGEVLRVAGGEGPAFDVAVPLEGAGVHRVELLARGARGDTVVANFPLYVGVDPPSSISLVHADDAGAERSTTDVEDRLFALLNESRRAFGRAPLVRESAIDRVAAAHSRDMVASGFVGHVSPTTGNPTDRVSRAGLRSGLVLENIGRAYGARSLHEGLLESPGHRATLLNPDVTHVGLGVVAEPEGSRTAWVATEVFLRMAQAIDLETAPDTVRGLLDRARTARGHAPLEADPNLTRAAAEAAAQFFADPRSTQQDIIDDASAGLRRFAIQFRRIGGLMAVVTDLSEAGALEPALDGEVRYVGVGVAQGTRPDTGANAIAVVIMLGWSR